MDEKYTAGAYYHSTNRINIPARLFVSREYNIGVHEIEIDGVMLYNKCLFQAIAGAPDVKSASAVFEGYMEQIFELEERVNGKKVGSFHRVLKSWLFDSNSRAGAVVKGWVENRFGLIPFFHKKPITGLHTEEYYEYMQDKMDTRTNRNSMYSQFDLLYTYVQTIIKAFYPQYVPRITLYRGVNDLSEHHIIEEKSRRNYCIEQNSVASFTSEKEIAEQFGSIVLKAEIPYTKIAYFSGALPERSFNGEMEYLVLGGRYDMEIVY